MENLIRKIFGYCGDCKKYFKYPRRRQMLTSYNDEESNFSCVCKKCFDYSEFCWEAAWKDYNSGRI